MRSSARSVSFDGLIQDGLEIALGSLAVLGEDQDPTVVPRRQRPDGRSAECRQPLALVLV